MADPTNDEVPDCLCGNSYLAIRTDIYKDGREFVYCDCCGALATKSLWCLASQAPAQPAPGVLSDDYIRLIYSEETGFILDESPAALLDFARALLAAQPVRGSAQPGHAALIDRLKLEAQMHAMEARTANATIAEIYQIVTGSTGEPGNWHGAEPVRAAFAEHAALLRQALEALELGRDALEAVAERYHVEKRGRRPADHARIDAQVSQADAAITAIRSALATTPGGAD